MKNLIRFLFVLLAVLMLPVVAFCQEVAAGAASETGFDPQAWFVSLAAMVGAVMTITQWIKGLLLTAGIGTKLLSWMVSIVLAFLGWYFELGILAGLQWFWVAIYALSAGLVANSIVDLNIVQAILKLFR